MWLCEDTSNIYSSHCFILIWELLFLWVLYWYKRVPPCSRKTKLIFQLCHFLTECWDSPQKVETDAWIWNLIFHILWHEDFQTSCKWQTFASSIYAWLLLLHLLNLFNILSSRLYFLWLSEITFPPLKCSSLLSSMEFQICSLIDF